jgi:hypothetical protein
VSAAAPAVRRRGGWIIGLGVAALVVIAAPVWAPVLLMFAIAGLDELAQRTTVHQMPPGTMPLVAPGEQARSITRGGPCYFCASGTRGSTRWGSSFGAGIPLWKIDRDVSDLLPRSETPRRVQLVALEPMVILVRDDPAEAEPEGGFDWGEGYLSVHGGRWRIWHGTTIPGPLAGLSWATPGRPLAPVAAEGARAVLPLQKGRLALVERDGSVTVTRE